MTGKTTQRLRLLGLELYFEDVSRARDFYCGVLGLSLEEEKPGHHVKLAPDGGFLCLEHKGVENYTSQDKAVVFSKSRICRLWLQLWVPNVSSELSWGVRRVGEY